MRLWAVDSMWVGQILCDLVRVEAHEKPKRYIEFGWRLGHCDHTAGEFDALAAVFALRFSGISLSMGIGGGEGWAWGAAGGIERLSGEKSA